MSPVLAAVIAAALAMAGWRARALTGVGAVAAAAVGTAVLAGAGWPGAAALGTFFISSNTISRLGPEVRLIAGDPKSDRRDHWQVLANGGPAALGALLARDQPGLALWVATSSLAAAGADTWATTVGAWSRTPPRHLLTWRLVPPGTNGGITLLGTLGALAGAALVAGAAAWIGRAPKLAVTAGSIGFCGMLLDSALGASLQGRFRCPACDLPSEWPIHRCGTQTVRTGGVSWLDNDGVNAVATTLAALAGWWCWR